ncbi:hypothetical protein NL393_35980, partial [Klebsiella pneumoniae]|nr:hypothetical protein [Klebsiella pneumoniae]
AVALILSPALTATLLKQRKRGDDGSLEGGWLERKLPRVAHVGERLRYGFNSRFDRGIDRYERGVIHVIDRKWLYLLLYAAVLAIL